MKLIDLVYPDKVADPEAEKARLELVLRNWAGIRNERHVTLDTLIQLAHKESTPAIKLSDEAQGLLFDLLKGSSHSSTRARLGNKIRFGLAMWPALWWGKRLYFYFDGHVAYCGGQDSSVEIPLVRKAICDM